MFGIGCGKLYSDFTKEVTRSHIHLISNCASHLEGNVIGTGKKDTAGKFEGDISFLKFQEGFFGEVAFDFNFVANDLHLLITTSFFFCILANNYE